MDFKVGQLYTRKEISGMTAGSAVRGHFKAGDCYVIITSIEGMGVPPSKQTVPQSRLIKDTLIWYPNPIFTDESPEINDMCSKDNHVFAKMTHWQNGNPPTYQYIGRAICSNKIPKGKSFGVSGGSKDHLIIEWMIHMPNPEVTLEVVYRWRCPLCGSTNIANSVPVEFNDEAVTEMAKENGISEEEFRDSIQEGLVTAPATVVCMCHQRFKVAISNQNDNPMAG